jgi:hypothetical protein
VGVEAGCGNMEHAEEEAGDGACGGGSEWRLAAATWSMRRRKRSLLLLHNTFHIQIYTSYLVYTSYLIWNTTCSNMEHAEEAVVALCCFLEVLRSPLCLGSVHKIKKAHRHVCVCVCVCACVRQNCSVREAEKITHKEKAIAETRVLIRRCERSHQHTEWGQRPLRERRW